MNYYYDSCGEISYLYAPFSCPQFREDMKSMKGKKLLHWMKLLQELVSS